MRSAKSVYYKVSGIPLLLLFVGCALQSIDEQPDFVRDQEPVRVESDEISITLVGVLAKGHKSTLVDDPGWLEFLFEINNRSDGEMLIETVKLLDSKGRYLESARSYEEVVRPPRVGAEIAGDVAKSTASVVAGQVIPFGGVLTGVVSRAASGSSAASRSERKRVFMVRVLQSVELAPGGEVSGSAFLPNIKHPKKLTLVYSMDGQRHRIDMGFPTQAIQSE